MGRFAVLVVLLFGYSSGHGIFVDLVTGWMVFGTTSPIFSLASDTFHLSLLCLTTQRASFHNLRLPSPQYSCSSGL